MISKETIALVRERADLEVLVRESVPTLKKAGRRLVGLCPFHKEKSPSFSVNPDAGVYHCFGCKESGDAIRFLERMEGYTFIEAVRALAERFGVAIEEERGAVPTDADRHKKEREELYGIMNMAASFYEEQLRTHSHCQYALDELARRSLEPTNDAVQAFGVGRARVVPQEAGRVPGRGRKPGAHRAEVERQRVLRPVPASPHVRGGRRSRPRGGLQRPGSA
jgi:DNA primase